MLGKPTVGGEWYEHEHMKSFFDRRIPYNLLSSTDGERCFLAHRKDLQEKRRQEELKSRFKNLLMTSSQVGISSNLEKSFFCFRFNFFCRIFLSYF